MTVRLRGVGVLLGMLSATTIHAHDFGPGSWINRNGLRDPLSKEYCCNATDCKEVERGGLEERNGGYHIVETGEMWAYHRVIWQSQDGLWYRCRYMADQDAQRRRNGTRCLIGPMPTM